MRNEKVFEWLSEKGFADRVIDHTETIDTVEHAAIQLGCSEAEMNGYGKEKALTNPPAPVSDDGISVEIIVDGKKYSGKLNKA